MATKRPAKQSDVKPKPTKALKVKETTSFTREVKKLLSESERQRLRQEAAQFRELGSTIRGTGGLRKMRWALDNNKGKSGGARIIYFYSSDDMPLYLIAFYPKSAQADLTPEQKKAAKKYVESIKADHEAKKPKLRLVQ